MIYLFIIIKIKYIINNSILMKRKNETNIVKEEQLNEHDKDYLKMNLAKIKEIM